MLILIWDHMIDWDVLFDLQKNKKQDYPSYNQISWDWHCGTKQHGFAILFIAHVKKMCKQIPKKNASHGCYNQINMSLSLKGEKAKKCPCFLHHPFINTSVKDLQVRIEPCGFTYLFDEKFEDFVEQYASSNKVDLSKISNWSEYDFPLHSLRQYLSYPPKTTVNTKYWLKKFYHKKIAIRLGSGGDFIEVLHIDIKDQLKRHAANSKNGVQDLTKCVVNRLYISFEVEDPDELIKFHLQKKK
eukprot:524398_1